MAVPRNYSTIIGEDAFWSLVDRYYDPTTDQFISVDPDVAQTGQPYAYDLDDPLNVTDPLGLSGGVKQDVQYLAAVAKNKKYCKAHPNAKGHNCGGFFHELAGTVSKGAHIVRTHPLATVSIIAGTITLAFAPEVGAEIDADAIGALSSGADLSTASALQTVKTVAGLTAVGTDLYDCANNPGINWSCASALVGGHGLATADPAEVYFGPFLSLAHLLSGG